MIKIRLYFANTIYKNPNGQKLRYKSWHYKTHLRRHRRRRLNDSGYIHDIFEYNTKTPDQKRKKKHKLGYININNLLGIMAQALILTLGGESKQISAFETVVVYIVSYRTR